MQIDDHRSLGAGGVPEGTTIPPFYYPSRLDVSWGWHWFLQRFWAVSNWIGTEGLVPVFLAVVVASALAAELLAKPAFWFVPAVFAAGIVVLWAVRTRRRLVIEEFSNETNKDALVGGAALLAIELARIRDLFRVVDERNTLRTAVGEQRPLDAAVKVDELTSVLGSSVTPETNLTVGPVTVPVGTIMTLLGRVTQGPRLRCHVHEVDSRYVVSAQLSGLRTSPVWRLERPLRTPTAAARAQALDDIIPELACRVFTNLGLKRKVKWQAMRSFTEALRIYRSCLRTPKDRAVKLLRAQQNLVEALAHDEDFVLVYYNLGVVYSELARLAKRARKDPIAERHEQAAEAAFRKAIEHDPMRWESYYALARIEFQHGSRQAARDLCERVVRLSPQLRRSAEVERAKAYDLLAHCVGAETRKAVAYRAEASIGALGAVRRGYRKRIAGSEDDPLPTLNDLAANCLANLGISDARYMQGRRGWHRRRRFFRRRSPRDRVVALFRLAQRLTTKGANLHYELGKIAMAHGDHELAIEELTSATRVEPEHALFWTTLARANADAGEDDAARRAAVRAESALNLLDPEPNDRKAIKKLAKVWRSLEGEDSPLATRLQERAKFARELRAMAKALEVGERDSLTRAQADHFERVLHEVEGLARDLPSDPQKAWEAAHVSAVLGRHRHRMYSKAMRAGERAEAAHCADEAVELLSGAIARLKKNGLAKDVVRHDLHARLARALVATHRGNATALRDAQAEAERAVSLNPLSSTAHDALAHVYNAFDDLERAKASWTQALLLRPDNPLLHWELGYCCRRLARDAGSLQARRALLDESRTYLQNAADVFPYEDFRDRVRVHYWLARVHEELGDSERVIPALKLVQTSPELATVADFLVAQAHRRLGNYSEAEHLYDRVMSKTEGSEAIVGVHEVDETWPYETLRGRAMCSLAMLHADRHGDVDRATELLDEVEAGLGDLEAKAAEAKRPEGYAARVRELKAAMHHGRGRVALDEAELEERKSEEALTELETSLRIRAHPEVYFDLAVANWRRAAYVDDEEREQLLERAQRYCALVRVTDARELCVGRLEGLIPRLDAALLQHRVSRRRRRGEPGDDQPPPPGGGGPPPPDHEPPGVEPSAEGGGTEPDEEPGETSPEIRDIPKVMMPATPSSETSDD